MKKRNLKKLAAYKTMRRRTAMTIGSEWIYFNRFTPDTCTGKTVGRFHPWNGCSIKITSAKKATNGRLVLRAVCTDLNGMLINAIDARKKPIQGELAVTYSELW